MSQSASDDMTSAKDRESAMSYEDIDVLPEEMWAEIVRIDGDEDIDVLVDNLPRWAQSEEMWAEVVKQVEHSKSIDDLEAMRAAARELDDPHFGSNAGRIGPRLKELVELTNARLRKLR
jgi:hypothetical protein